LQVGIRPEFVSFASAGIPVHIKRVDDVGRHRIVAAEHENQTIRLVVPEAVPIPQGTACVAFPRDKTALYVDGWLHGHAPANAMAIGAVS
jgi:glycerol transport system ATP-binding protein